MKRITCLFLILSLMLSFIACSGNGSSGNDLEYDFEQLEWPNNENAKQIPIPKSTLADVGNCNDRRFDFYLANTTFEDYKAYVEECKTMGFTIDAIEQENRYFAYNDTKYELTIQYKDGDIMYVSVVEYRLEIEIKLLHTDKTSADMYDIRIEIDGYWEEDSEQGDEAITFTAAVKEGTHTLLIENDDDDDINGRIDFSVSADSEYLEFEINCLSNKIEIFPAGTTPKHEIETPTIVPSDKNEINIPVVGYYSFNVTDKELIDWINSVSDMTVSYTELGLDSDVNTGYRITLASGETGVLILNHGDGAQHQSSNVKDGDVCGIMTTFDEYSTCLAVLIWLGEHINSDFSSDSAIDALVGGDAYSAANMTVLYLEDSNVAILAPSTYIASILD